MAPQDQPSIIEQLRVDPITADMTNPLVLDYTSGKLVDGLNDRQRAYASQVAQIFKSPDLLNAAPADGLVSDLIRQGNQIGGVDDITARATRDIMRLKGNHIKEDADVDGIFNAYKIKLPPLDGIKFKDYSSLDDEHEKLDGWAAQAKAAYSLKTKARHPELIAYRDEIFQKIDDTAKGLKRKVGSTDSVFVDFVGRLAEGGASLFDTIGLDSVGNFIRKHSATNPEWDADTSSIIGQAIGQGATMLAVVATAGGLAKLAAGAVGVSTVVAGTAVTAARLGTVATSALGGTQSQRRENVLRATGSEELADAAATTTSAYLEAALDTVIDYSLLGASKLGAGKASKKLAGQEGRTVVAGGLTDAAAKIAAQPEALTRLARLADIGGDVLYQGSKEAVTEMLQGAISDTSVGAYTNMRDRFDPFDIRNRAADAIGGFAGGAAIAGLNRYVLPKNRIPTPPTPEDTAQFAAQSTANRDPAAEAVMNTSMDAQVKAAAAEASVNQSLDLILATNATEPGGGGGPPTAPTPPEQPIARPPPYDEGAMYSNMKESLGDNINNPAVQKQVETMLIAFDSARSYLPAERPADAAASTDAVITPDALPEIQAAAALDTTAAPPIETAAAAVADTATTPDQQLASFDDLIKQFPTNVTPSLEGGGKAYQFSLATKASAATGLEAEQQGNTRIIGRGDAISAPTYQINTDAAGNFTGAFKITPKEGLVRQENIQNMGDARALVDKVAESGVKRKTNAKGRTRTGVQTDRALTKAVPEDIIRTLSAPAQNLVSLLGPKVGGDHVKRAKEQSAYLNDGRAYADLTASGLDPEQATNQLSQIRSVMGSEFNNTDPKRAVLRNLQWNLLKSGRTDAEVSAVVESLYEGRPNYIAAVKKGLGLTATEAPITATTAAPPVTPAPAAQPAKTGLQYNRALQRMAVENRMSDPKVVERIMSELDTNPEMADNVVLLTENYIDSVDSINPTDTPEEAIDKASGAGTAFTDASTPFARTRRTKRVGADANRMTFSKKADSRFNAGAFKTQAQTPFQRSAFALGRILNRLGINRRFDLEIPTSTALDQQITGEFNPGTQTINTSREISGSQQAVFAQWHELGEYAAQNHTNFMTSVSASSGIDLGVLQNSAKDVSDSIRQTPLNNPIEEGIDATSMYLYARDAMIQSHPDLADAFDRYISNNPDSELAKAHSAVGYEDSLTPEQKARAFSAEQAARRTSSNERFATRNIDPRGMLQKIKDYIHEINRSVFNAATNLEKLADKLKIIPAYKQMGQDFDRYYSMFKNRDQTVGQYKSILGNHFTNKLEAIGVTRDQLSDYLTNTRIVDERTAWEGIINSQTLTNQEAFDILDSFASATDLIDDSLMQRITDLNLYSPATIVDTDEFLSILHEFAAKAFASTPGTLADAAAAIQKTTTNRMLKRALQSAFAPLSQSRRDIQNPGAVDAVVAQRFLDIQKNNMTPEQWQAMKDMRENVMAPILRKVISDAEAAGTVGQDAADYYRSNASNYVTFQDSDMIAIDPTISSAITNQTGINKPIADPFVTTALKTEAIAARAASQAFQNFVTDMAYVGARVSNAPPIVPIAYSVDDQGNNDWVTDFRTDYATQGNRAIPSDPTQRTPIENFVSTGAGEMQPVRLSDLHKLMSQMNSDNKANTYMLSANNGTYVLHEVQDSTLKDVISPKSLADQNQVVQALNKAQVIARAFFTTNSIPFALRAIPKASTQLYRNRRVRAKGDTPTEGEFYKDVLRAPIFGIPLYKEDRQLMRHAYQRAFEYMRNAGNTDIALDALNKSFDSTTTLQDILNDPNPIARLVAAGQILVNTASGIDPTIVQNSLAGSIMSSASQSEIDQILYGLKNPKSIYNRMNNYGGAGAPIIKQVLKRFRQYIETTGDLNNALELGEKYQGIIAYMTDGMSFDDAVIKANKYFGNPDPKGGGANKHSLSWASLYLSSALGSARVTYEAIGKAGLGPDKDQQFYKGTAMAVRNRLILSPLVFGGAAYVLSKALGGSDDEAEKTAAVMRRLLSNIPDQDKKSGMGIPLMFRDPRSGELHFPWEIDDPADIDPSWTTVYLQAPFDPNTGAMTGLIGGAFDAMSRGVGIPSVVANALTSSLGQMAPSVGPVVGTGLTALSAVRGQNPTNQFTGESVVSDAEFKAGGTALGLRYMQYAASQFIPPIGFAKRDALDKSKIFEPTGIGIFDFIPQLMKAGLFMKESNYGQVQASTHELNLANRYSDQVKAELPEGVRAYAARGVELERQAKQLLALKQDELKQQGMPEKEAARRSADLLSPGLRQQLLDVKIWEKTFYDPLREKAELALYADDTQSYQAFLSDLEKSLPE